MKYGTRGSVFPDTRGSALSSWSPLCNYWTAVNPSHFRLSIKRSVKFFYLAPICSAGTGQVSVLCSIASIHLHFFCTLRVRAPLRGWKCCSTFWSFLPPPPPLSAGSSISTGDPKAERVSPALPLRKNILISPASPCQKPFGKLFLTPSSVWRSTFKKRGGQTQQTANPRVFQWAAPGSFPPLRSYLLSVWLVAWLRASLRMEFSCCRRASCVLGPFSSCSCRVRI